MNAGETKEQLQMLLYIGTNGVGICEGLFDEGYTGLSLLSCKRALAWLEKQLKEARPLPTAIFCDAEIPEKDLASFVGSVRQSEKLTKAPILLLSKKQAPEDRAKALRLKADDFFFKPYQVEDIAYRLDFLKSFRLMKLNEGKTSRLRISKRMLRSGDRMLKRGFDIVASGIGLLLLSPLFLLVAIIIKVESKGNIFYVSKRAGTGYQVFDFYKFRSMRSGADKEVTDLLKTANQYGERKDKKDPQFFKMQNDPRITRFGNFLRKTSIDELPQLYNVLKGDMSLVGNRPLPLYEAETLTSDQWAARFSAPAGITGLWQITKRGKAEMSPEERMELDIQYAQNYSFFTDLKIILMTIPALVQKEKV
jgi:lipopolysaccharide/colanic/teichoic acid biosynthesis glycosyltransferase